MEGDAGAGRLNPPPMPTRRRLLTRNRIPRPKIGSESEAVTEETSNGAQTEHSAESEVGTDQTDTEATTADESAESEPAVEASEDAEVDASEADTAEASQTGTARGPSRLGRRWLAAIAAVLLLAAGAIAAGGYFALHYHQQSQAIARNNAAAIKAAIDCVSATQAPDTNAMVASEQKIIDCGTDDFRAQALLSVSMLVQAYQAANVHVQVSDVRAAVERNHSDGSVEILVALRVKVASDQSQNETGYRLRAKMASAGGQYKISKLEVAK